MLIFNSYYTFNVSNVEKEIVTLKMKQDSWQEVKTYRFISQYKINT